MPWDPFLMKVLLKKEVCESREQCTGPIGKAWNTLPKKKKKNEMQMLNTEVVSKRIHSTKIISKLLRKSTCLAYKERSKLWTPGSSLCKRWTQYSKYLMTSCVSFLHVIYSSNKPLIQSLYFNIKNKK